MKDTHVLVLVGIIALIAIAAVFVGYATDTLPKHTQRVITTAPPVTSDTAETVNVAAARKKKTCGCCKERMEKLRKHLEKLGERERAAQQTLK